MEIIYYKTVEGIYLEELPNTNLLTLIETKEYNKYIKETYKNIYIRYEQHTPRLNYISSGPWCNEPDNVLWKYNNLYCLVFREPYWGYLGAYIALNNTVYLRADKVYESNLTVLGANTRLDTLLPNNTKASIWLSLTTPSFGYYPAGNNPTGRHDYYGSSSVKTYKSFQEVKQELERLIDEVVL
jgi:hypothetical protein